MAKNINKQIFEQGRIVAATKLPVVTIGLGLISQLIDLAGTVSHNADGKVVIVTKEAPNGCLYEEQNRTAVVRIIGDKVLIDGKYDIYAPDNSKIEKLLSNPIDLYDIPEDQLNELKPLLAVASEVRPSLAPSEPGRKVIIITDDMVGEQGYINCHCPWDPEDTETPLYVGDAFLVEDEANFVGYRIGKEEFEGTHSLD